jgi:tRNA-dihydrouridine synthase
VEAAGYDEVNLNAGCPSNRVASKQAFGAALMQDVDLTVRMLQAMRQTASIPVSIKTRIGVDDCEGWEFLWPFMERLIKEGGVRRIYLHARKVYTTGLNPAQNRNIPPLDYSVVYRLCRHFPECDFWINGGIQTLQQAKDICYGKLSTDSEQHGRIPCLLCQAPHGSCIAPPGDAPPNLRGCMVGRIAMEHPSSLALVDTFFYGASTNPSRNRRHVLDQYCQYLQERYPRRCCDSNPVVTTAYPPPTVVLERDACCVCGSDNNEPSESVVKIVSRIIDRALKPVFGIFFGMPGASAWRRACDQVSRDLKIRNCGPAFCLKQAIQQMPDKLLDQDFEDMSLI